MATNRHGCAYFTVRACRWTCRTSASTRRLRSTAVAGSSTPSPIPACDRTGRGSGCRGWCGIAVPRSCSRCDDMKRDETAGVRPPPRSSCSGASGGAAKWASGTKDHSSSCACASPRGVLRVCVGGRRGLALPLRLDEATSSARRGGKGERGEGGYGRARLQGLRSAACAARTATPTRAATRASPLGAAGRGTPPPPPTSSRSTRARAVCAGRRRRCGRAVPRRVSRSAEWRRGEASQNGASS